MVLQLSNNLVTRGIVRGGAIAAVLILALTTGVSCGTAPREGLPVDYGSGNVVSDAGIGSGPDPGEGGLPEGGGGPLTGG